MRITFGRREYRTRGFFGLLGAILMIPSWIIFIICWILTAIAFILVLPGAKIALITAERVR